MSPAVLRREQHRRMPWANGGGTTLEVARFPHGSGSAFVWRVSLADVEADGPFSVLPGIDRIIVLARGPRMMLTVDGVQHALRPGLPFAFSGDSDVSCAVPSATRDLNVMTRRGDVTASVEIVEEPSGSRVEARGAEHVVLVCLRGPPSMIDPVGAVETLRDFDAAFLHPGDTVTVDGAGCVALARIRVADRPVDPRATAGFSDAGG